MLRKAKRMVKRILQQKATLTIGKHSDNKIETCDMLQETIRFQACWLLNCEALMRCASFSDESNLIRDNGHVSKFL